MIVTASEPVAPGSVLTVQYPVPQSQQQGHGQGPTPPTVPPPEVDMTQEDEAVSQRLWAYYVAAWGCFLCCIPLVGVIMFMVLAGAYYCRPAEQRALRPRQRKVAFTSLLSCLGLFLTASCFGIYLASTGQLPAEFHRYRPHHHHRHGGPPGEMMMSVAPEQPR